MPRRGNTNPLKNSTSLHLGVRFSFGEENLLNEPVGVVPLWTCSETLLLCSGSKQEKKKRGKKDTPMFASAEEVGSSKVLKE